MRYLVTVVFVCFSLMVSAQEDTVYLSEVAVSGDPIDPFVVGGTLQKVEVSDYDLNLSEALSGSNLYFKTYGNQQLSTISMRGTSASQTNVMWHGIPVNYPTLGQMDFSQWPTWLLTSIELQPGSGGALFGSGSIGGTVLLDSDTEMKDQATGVTLRADAGSFGYSFLGVKGNYKLGNVVGQTRVYRNGLQNNFSYIYNGDKYIQENAGVTDRGIRQTLQWSQQGHQLAFDGIFTTNDREIQPVKGNTSENQLGTGNLRLALTHRYVNSGGSFNTTFGFIRNRTLYNQEQETIANQYSVVSTYVFDLGQHALGRIGFNSNMYRAQSDSFRENLTDIRTGLFVSITTPITRYWKTTINARQSIFKDQFPFNPSLNQQVTLFKNLNQRFSLTQSVSTGFRFPTLNDLYWTPGGNPDLKPERSLNADAGIKWESESDLTDWGSSLNVFKLWARDYILWRPGNDNIWSPENIREVHSGGIEYKGWVQFEAGSFTQKVTGSYGYTRSLNQTGTNKGKQLPYVPIHQGTINMASAYSSWSVDLTTSYTSRRYTTLDNTLAQSVEGFFIMNVGLGKQFIMEKWKLNLGLRADNVLDSDYENLINMAMPGRNFQLYILIKR